MISLFELLRTRRSIRKYLPKAVEQDKIDKITCAALMSPASKRSNPWEFIVVEDKQMLLKLSECRIHGSQMLSDSPLAIVVIADKTKSDVWIEDASIAAIIMQLEAHDLELGSCWVQVYDRDKDENTTAEAYIRELFAIPEQFGVLCILSIGYPNEERKPYETIKLATHKIHSEKF
ncbi:MAG: nitroreductase family protein [Bacteroidota bacterium]|nr:nitroreductase family protein [Bacteroidota bacterium]